MKRKRDLVREEIHLARRIWGAVGTEKMKQLGKLIRLHQLSIALGDVLLIENGWYITHAGLLRLAHRKHCSGIKTTLDSRCSDPQAQRWVFKATVYNSASSRGFVGYGDADPSNVSSLVHGAELRVAEARAVNRALRKAYGIGICSVEELGARRSSGSAPSNHRQSSTVTSNGHSNGQPRLRDRLCLLIRQHQLDADLVKAYAAHFCGTSSLREASRESVEAFISRLAEQAVKDRAGLLCQLNSYAKPMEVSQ